jgi:hypothetical protein
MSAARMALRSRDSASAIMTPVQPAGRCRGWPANYRACLVPLQDEPWMVLRQLDAAPCRAQSPQLAIEARMALRSRDSASAIMTPVQPAGRCRGWPANRCAPYRENGELLAWLTGYTVSETRYRACLVPLQDEPWMVLRRRFNRLADVEDGQQIDAHHIEKLTDLDALVRHGV